MNKSSGLEPVGQVSVQGVYESTLAGDRKKNKPGQHTNVPTQARGAELQGDSSSMNIPEIIPRELCEPP